MEQQLMYSPLPLTPDPEVSDDPTSVIGGGRDVSTYPTVKSYTFGIRINF